MLSGKSGRHDVAPPVRDNDITFAHKALNIVPGLTDAARRVAGAIIDHFNKRTGQCDPSIERLATMLGVDRATVIRATEKLHAAGLIEKISHGGNSHRTCYLPNWAQFNAVVADWDARMKTGSPPSDLLRPAVDPAETPARKVAGMRRSRSQACDFNSRKDATRTLRSNPSNKPIEGERGDAREKFSPTSSPQNWRNGLLSGSVRKPDRPDSMPSLVAGMSRSEIAEQVAAKRLDADLRALGQAAYADALERITPELTDAATRAEVAVRGSGVRLVIQRLSRRAVAP